MCTHAPLYASSVVQFNALDTSFDLLIYGRTFGFPCNRSRLPINTSFLSLFPHFFSLLSSLLAFLFSQLPLLSLEMANNLPDSADFPGGPVDGPTLLVVAGDEVSIAPSGGAVAAVGASPFIVVALADGAADPHAGDSLQNVVAGLQDELAREQARNERVEFNLRLVVSDLEQKLRPLGQRHRRLIREIDDGAYPFLDPDEVSHGSDSSVYSEEEAEENMEEEEDAEEEEAKEESDEFSDDDGYY